MTKALKGVVLAAALCLGAAPASRADSIESAKLGGQASFFTAAAGGIPRLSPVERGAIVIVRPEAAGGYSSDFEKYIKEHTSIVGGQPAQNQAGSAALELDLAAMRNRHFKTRLAYTLSGKQLWVSGSFDRSQNAYVSILVEGQEVVFFNVSGLLDKEQPLTIGGVKYKVYLAPNVFNKLKSEIVLENLANEEDQKRVQVIKLLQAATAAGEQIKLGDQGYSVFYFDDVKDGRLDASRQTFAFSPLIEDFKIYLVGAEQVPSDKINVFPMFKDRRVGLMQAGGKLRIFDNP